MKRNLIAGLSMIMLLTCQSAFAQFNVDGQILQRSEYRHGFGRLIAKEHQPAAFIAHRARLQATYDVQQFSFYMSIQDVRTWGSSPQVKATDPYLSVHEAWAAVKFGDNWQVKLGRQELNYDNFRFLGNLDWALQGRAHDFALVKYEKENAKLHFGGAYNQDAQQLADNLFTTPNQYKVAQMVRYENKWDALQFSLLFWNDGRQFFQRDASGNLTQKELYYRQTLGIPTMRYTKGNSVLSGFYYHQFGKDPVGRSTNAFNLSIWANQRMAVDQEKGSALTLSTGFEILSGTPTNDRSQNRSFSPLYGTNHLFNGYMDLFYVGGAHESTVGLEDLYLKGRYAFNKKLFVQTDLHAFSAQNNVFRLTQNNITEELPSYLGTEIDFTLGYILNDAVSVQGGYSHFFHTDTFAALQPNANLSPTQNWAYLMLVFRPTMKNKFIGILL
jgi:hypothetical protein